MLSCCELVRVLDVNAELLFFELLDFSSETKLIGKSASRVLMFKVALDAVLLVILFIRLLTGDSPKLINWIIKLSVQISSLNREVTSDQPNSVKPTLYLIKARCVINHYTIITPYRFAESEALEHMVHELLLTLHRNHIRFQAIKVETACQFLAPVPSSPPMI